MPAAKKTHPDHPDHPDHSHKTDKTDEKPKGQHKKEDEKPHVEPREGEREAIETLISQHEEAIDELKERLK